MRSPAQDRTAKAMGAKPVQPNDRGSGAELLFEAAFGAFLGIALLKFGNPVILDRLIERPTNLIEWLIQPWPVGWGYVLLAGVVVCGLKVVQFQTSAPRWLVWVPLVWIVWQCLASLNSINPSLSRSTLTHFAACLICFYTGLFALGRIRQLKIFWIGLLVGFALVLWSGLEQHYGGLEATRRYIYSQPDWRQYPPEYLKKIASNRIFSTLVYPNALAGAILLLLPPLVRMSWDLTSRFARIGRLVVLGLLIYGGAACLFWSGSKSGWLIALIVGLVALTSQPIQRRFKWMIAAVTVCVGLVGFFVKFAPYFQKGATSVSARFDYWQAAVSTARQHPLLGTGPGTFSVAYARIKPPQAEMARLAHNDYLEQASDSGLIGFSTYCAFVWGALVFLFRRCQGDPSGVRFWVWLGLMGWTLQQFVEFSLYIPAISWCAFALLGWLLAQGNQIDTRQPTR